LPRLKDLYLGFRRGTPNPGRISQPPITRTVLPSLSAFVFDGLFEYLEDFVAQIDTPWLKCFQIEYLNNFEDVEDVDFEIPQLSKFIDRSEKLSQFSCAELDVQHDTELDLQDVIVVVKLGGAAELDGARFGLIIRDIPEEWIYDVLDQISGILSNVDRLSISSYFWKIHGSDKCPGDCIPWLDLLLPFTAVKALSVQARLSEHAASIVSALRAEVLPGLELLCLEYEKVMTTRVEEFVAARRNQGRPVTFVRTMEEFRERLGLGVDEDEDYW